MWAHGIPTPLFSPCDMSIRERQDPSNLKLCQRGEWQDRMLVETVLSMLTLVTAKEARLLSPPRLRTGRESFPSSSSSISKAV